VSHPSTPSAEAPVLLAGRLYVGIDIGAGSIQVATSAGTNENLALEPGWPSALTALVGPRPVAAFEPTGRHYSNPIVRVLDDLGATLLQVDHSTTKRYRLAHVSTHKTDAIDARTLMMIAREHLNGNPVRGVKLHDPAAEQLTTALRAALSAYRRAKTDSTRTQNRIKQLAYGVWPELAERKAIYERAASAGAVTPAQIVELARRCEEESPSSLPSEYQHGMARNALISLAQGIPARLSMPPGYEDLLAYEHAHLRHSEARAAVLEKHLEELISQPRILSVTMVWLTIPAASTYAVAALHAAAHCRAESFSGDQLRAALGFYPQQVWSGTKKATRQPMAGYKPARAALHLWTMRLLKDANRPNPIADYFDRRKAEGAKYAFPAARSKLARVLAGIARGGEPCRWE
jgi:transposase